MRQLMAPTRAHPLRPRTSERRVDVFESPFGPLNLERTPGRRSELRGWNAAEEYVLAHLIDRFGSAALPGRIIVVNPAAGAVPLALALGGASPVVVTDSAVDVLAMQANAVCNGIDPDRFTVVADPRTLVEVTGWGEQAADVVVVMVPKGQALLEAQLREIAGVVDDHTVVVGTGMTRHVHRATIDAFADLIGPATTSLARRKARLIQPTPDPTRCGPLAPSNGRPTIEVTDRDLRLVSEPGVFGAERVDAGTRLLLDHLPPLDQYAGGPDSPVRVIDLGCGNGVIGAAIARRYPGAELTLIDESYAAIRSARATFEATVGLAVDAQHQPRRRPPRFVVGDGLRAFVPGDDATPHEPGADDMVADVIITNPPFHHDHAVTDEIAWSFFHGARRVLRRGGVLVVVGNRHLNYHNKLRRLFGNVDTIGSSKKFVVLAAHKR